MEYRNDMVLRIIDEIAFLSTRLAGMKALGLSQEILTEIELLEQEAGKLEPEGKKRVAPKLEELRENAGNNLG